MHCSGACTRTPVCVRAEIKRAACITQRRQQRAQRVKPSVQRRAIQARALALAIVLQPIAWQVVVEAANSAFASSPGLRVLAAQQGQQDALA